MIATYISATQFRVEGDLTAEFLPGRRIKANCSGDGYKYSTITDRSYSAPYTTVTIAEPELTSNLIDVLYGIVNIGPEGAFPLHTHDGSEGQGGIVDFTDLSNNDIDFLQLTDTPSSYESGKILETTASGIILVDELSNFLQLTDTPSSYESLDGKFLQVVSSGIEFSDNSSWHIGNGTPAVNLGQEGDFYFDNVSGELYSKQSWIENSESPTSTRDLGSFDDGSAGGTPTGPPIDNGTYYTFNGSTDGVDYGSGVGDETQIALKARVRFSNLNPGTAQTIWKSGGITNALALGIDASGNFGIFGRSSDILDSLTVAVSNLSENVWYTIYADQNRFTLVNESTGGLVFNSGANIGTANGTDNESIGCGTPTAPISWDGAPADFFFGDIDYVNVYTTGTLDFPSGVAAVWSKIGHTEVLLSGSGTPTASGTEIKESDKYIDEVTGDLYEYDGASWSKVFDFGDATTSVSGIRVNPTMWYTGAGEPGGTEGGILGDYFVDDVTQDLYRRNSGWTENSAVPSATRDIGSNQGGLVGGILTGSGIDNGDYYTFNGSDSYISWAAPYGTEANIDLKARFRIHNKNKGAEQVIWKSGGSGSGMEVGLDTLNNLGIFGRNTALTSNTIPNTQFDEDVWYILYASKTRITLLREGTQFVVESTGTINPANGGNLECLGGSPDTTPIDSLAGGFPAGYFEGDIDYIKMYAEGDLDFPDFSNLANTQWEQIGSVADHSTLSGIGGGEGTNVPLVTGAQGIKIEYKTGDELYVNPGYVHLRYSTYDSYVLDQRISITNTSLAADTWYFIYVDEPLAGNLLTAADFAISSNIPTIDYVNQGYYDGTRRCIGFALTNATGDMRRYNIAGGGYYYADDIITTIDWQVLTGDANNDFDVHVPFGNMIAIMNMYARSSTTNNSQFSIGTPGLNNQAEWGISQGTDQSVYANNQHPVLCDSSKQLRLIGAGSDFASRIWTLGFQMPDYIYGTTNIVDNDFTTVSGLDSTLYALELVESINLDSETLNTTISGITNDNYYMEYNLECVLNNDANRFRIRFNDDAGATNYSYSYHGLLSSWQSGTTITDGIEVGYTSTPDANNPTMAGHAELYLTGSPKVTLAKIAVHPISADTYNPLTYQGAWETVDEDVTSITMYSDYPMIGYINLYRRKNITFPLTAGGSGGGSSDVQSFMDLIDTPTTYSGTEGKFAYSTGTAIDFVSAQYADGRMQSVFYYTGAAASDNIRITLDGTTFSGSIGEINRTDLIQEYLFKDTGTVDTSGNGNNLTFSLAALTDGYFADSQSIYFDVNGEANSSGSGLSGDAEHSLAAHIFLPTAAPTSRQGCIVLGPQTNGAMHWLYNTSRTMSMGVWGIGGSAVDLAGYEGTWIHLAYTYDGSAGIHKTYLNGEYVNQFSGFAFNLNGTTILGEGVASEESFAGQIANFRLYDTALTETQIRDLANELDIDGLFETMAADINADPRFIASYVEGKLYVKGTSSNTYTVGTSFNVDYEIIPREISLEVMTDTDAPSAGQILRRDSADSAYEWVDSVTTFVDTDIVANTLVKEWNLTSSGIDEIFTWDGETEDLVMEFAFDKDPTISSFLTVLPNGDNNINNYALVQLGVNSSGTPTGTGQDPSTVIGLLVNGGSASSTQLHGSFYASLAKSPAPRRSFSSAYRSDTSRLLQYQTEWRNTIDYVTSVNISLPGSNTGRIKLYKRAKIALPIYEPNYVDTNLYVNELVQEWNLNDEFFNVTVSGLHGDTTDEILMFEYDIVVTGAAGGSLLCELNNDSTDTNYTRQWFGTVSNDTEIATDSPWWGGANLMLVNTGSASLDSTVGRTNLYLKSGKWRSSVAEATLKTGTGYYSDRSVSFWENTADEVTSFRLTSSSDNYTGTIKLYRFTDISLPIYKPNYVDTNLYVNELVDEFTFDNEVMSGTVSGIQGDTDNIYVIEGYIVDNSGAANILALKLNNDSGANYDVYYYGVNSGAVGGYSGGVSGETTGMRFGYSNIVGMGGTFNFRINLKSGEERFASSAYNRTGGSAFVYSSMWTNTVDEVTRMDLSSAGAVTGYAKVYKLVNIQLPVGTTASGSGDVDLSDYVPWDFGAGTISGTGDIYCNDLYTASGTVYIGDLKLSNVNGELNVNDVLIEGTTWLEAAGIPHDLNDGIDGNYYNDVVSKDVYKKRTAIVYNTWNPADKDPDYTLSNDDLTANCISGWSSIRSILSISSGKWYWEVHVDSNSSNQVMVGVGSSLVSLTNYLGNHAQGWGYNGNTGTKYNNGSSSGFGSSYSTGVTIGVALDMDSGKIWWSRNGVWQASGNPSTGANPAFSNLSGVVVYPMASNQTGQVTAHFGNTNFGTLPFAYTPPAGFLPGSYDAGAGNWHLVGTFENTGSTTFSGLSDTPVTYDEGKVLYSKANGTKWIEIPAGTLWLNGEGAPSGVLGSPNNYYLDTISGSVHSKTILVYGLDQCAGGTPGASEWYSSYGPANAFDNNTAYTTRWSTGSSPTYPVWIGYQFAAQKQIQKLRMHPANDIKSPRDFTFRASNTAAFSGEEIILLTVNAEPQWPAGEYKEYEFINDEGYLYYRIYITAINAGGGEVHLTEVDMMELDSAEWEPVYAPATVSGVDGADGADAATWITASGIPTQEIGVYGDHYLDLETYDIYRKDVPDYGVTDLFTGGTPTVSSENGGSGYPAIYAVDNNVNTHWFADSPTNEWLKYDFGVGNDHIVSKMRIHPRADAAVRNFKDYEIHGSNNDSDWTLLTSGTIPNGVPAWEDIAFSNGTSYRYIRVTVLNTYTNYCGINEAEAFALTGVNWGKVGNTKGADGADGADAPDTFLGLTDTPATYSGTDRQYLTSTGSGIDFIALSPVPAEGNWVLVAEITAADETFSESIPWDGDTWPKAKIETRMLSGTTAAADLKLRLNNDSTPNIYTSGYVVQNGADVSAASSTNDFMYFGLGSGLVTRDSFATTDLYLKSGGRRFAVCHDTIYDSGDLDRVLGDYDNYWSNTSSNVTSIDISATTACTGTFKIYRWRDITEASLYRPEPAPAEGNWVLVRELIADDESLAESVAWDGDTWPKIKIESYFPGHAAGDQVFAHLNNDTSANYTNTHMYQDGSSMYGGGTAAATDMGVLGWHNAANRTSFCSAEGILTSGGARVFRVEHRHYTSTNEDYGIVELSSSWKNTVSKVTSIDFDSVSNNTNCNIKIYRWRDITDIPVDRGKQSLQVEYATTSGIYINPGDMHMKDSYYGMYALENRLEVSFDSLASDTWYYVYTNVSGTGFQLNETNFTVSSGIPTKDYPNMGYYNGNYRCIGAVYVDDSGDIEEFNTGPSNYNGWAKNHNTNIEYTDVGIISSANTIIFSHTPAFSTMLNCLFATGTFVDNATLYYGKTTAKGIIGTYFQTSGRTKREEKTIFCNEDQTGKVWEDTITTSTFMVRENGYFLPDYIYTGA